MASANEVRFACKFVDITNGTSCESNFKTESGLRRHSVAVHHSCYHIGGKFTPLLGDELERRLGTVKRHQKSKAAKRNERRREWRARERQRRCDMFPSDLGPSRETESIPSRPGPSQGPGMLPSQEPGMFPSDLGSSRETESIP